MGGTGEDYFPQSFTHFSSLRPVKIVFEVLSFLSDVKEITVLPGLLSGVHITFGVEKGISREVIQRSTLMGNSHDRHRMWEKMSHFWKKFSPPVVWKCPHEQVQDAVKVTEQQECCGSSSEELIAVCWAPVSIYQTVLFTGQNPQGEEEESRATQPWPLKLQLKHSNNPGWQQSPLNRRRNAR